MWLKYLPKERVLPFGMKDNFWEMGATGPCGPCTEIHYDRIGNRDAAHLVNMDYPDVLEIWNLVFIQFNREPEEVEGVPGALKVLPSQHVDTGMGFERLASILQNKMSNYDTDIWQPIFKAIAAGSGLPEEQRKYTGKVGDDDTDVVDTAYRVVADHIRTLTFAITDGAAPGPKDRSYVLRRVLRRAVYYGQYILKQEKGFLHKLVDTVVDTMGDFYPELRANPDRVKELIKAEEDLFNKTLNDGVRMCLKEMSKLPKGSEIPAPITFRMYSTCGFPFDLTQRFAGENGYTVCRAAFDSEMHKEQELSRANQREGQGGLVFEAEQTAHLGSNKIAPTVDEPKFTWKNIPAKLVSIYNGKKKSFADTCTEGEDYVVLILDSTSFYAESGGQVGDQGKICSGESVFKVNDTLQAAGYILHIGTMLSGDVKVGAKVECQVDYENRGLVAPNHTMTHALNWALRKVLGSEVNQRGSLVDQEKSRFDFSASVVKPAQMEKVQQICKQMIKDDLKVYSKECSLKEALTINSLRAVFGEKYPDPVRVVSLGMPIDKAIANPTAPENMNYSIEFCGGTHLSSLGEAQELFLVKEEPVQSGVRRIEFITSTEANKARIHGEQILELLHAAQKMDGAEQHDECNKIRNIMQECAKDDSRRMPYLVRQEILNGLEVVRKKEAAVHKKAAKAKLVAATKHVEQLAAKATEAGAKFVVAELDLDTNSKSMTAVVKKFHKACKLPAFFVSTEPGSRSAVMCKAEVPKKGGAKIDCKAWAESVAGLVQGRAGGKANSGTCNGTDHSKLKEVLKTATDFAEKALS